MSWWTTFTDTATKVGTDAAQSYVQKITGTGAAPASPAPATTTTAASKPAWLIPAIIGGVLLLVVGYFATRSK